MKRISLRVLLLCSFFVSVAPAQTVTGSGTTNTVAKFTGSTTIGNSAITEVGGNVGVGTTTPGIPLEVVSNSTTQQRCCPGPSAIFGESTGSADLTVGITGLASARSGAVFGLAGITFSPQGNGVTANYAVNEGTDVGGAIFGLSGATSGPSFGVRGVAIATTGRGVGVSGVAFSAHGVAGEFVNFAQGTLLRGAVGGNLSAQSQTTVFRVDGQGTVFADGGFRPFGADFAESLAVTGSADHYVPGDLLAIDASGERRLSLSQTPYSTLVAGIYSTQPGVVASQHRVDEALPKNEVPLAIVGIVPCKVTAENGPIVPGDLLVTSSTPGHAMKGTDRARMLGAVVGKALEPLREGTGVIQVLVTLQ